MTIVAQLQLHYTAKIHERAAKVLLEFTGTPFSEDYKNIIEFEQLCEVSVLIITNCKSAKFYNFLSSGSIEIHKNMKDGKVFLRKRSDEGS